MRSLYVREVNATSPEHIETNPTEDSAWKLPESSFYNFLTTGTLSKTDQGAYLGFFPKKKETTALMGQLRQPLPTLWVKNMKALSLLGMGKK